jgi:shikimate dehydrogenase
MNATHIYLSNRTKEKAQILKNLFDGLEIVDWGILPQFDMIINATSLGLKESDKFEINFSKVGNNKLFFDVIYNPFKTEFSQAGNKPGNIIENGLNMFLFQAQKAFSIWHNIEPKINQELIEYLES